MLPQPNSYAIAFAVLLASTLFIAVSRRFRRQPRRHFPLRTRTLIHTYSATATARSNQPTHLVFPAPPVQPGDDTIEDAIPTIMRDFTEELLGLGYSLPKGKAKVIDLAARDRSRATHPRPPVFHFTQPPSSPLARQQAERLPDPQRDRRESQPLDPNLSLVPQEHAEPRETDLPVAGPSHLLPRPTQSPEQRERSSSPSENLGSPSGSGTLGEDVDYLVRHDRSPAKSEVKTFWWETKAPGRILCPPDLSRRPELFEGDIFVHRYGTYLSNGGEHQDMWMWTSERGNLHWKPVRQGYKRTDGRLLALTEGRKLPSWLDREWYLKRLAQDRL